MPAGGTTSELYLNENESGQHLGAPPSAPTPIPPPTKVEVSQPVVTKSRMADQKPDGSIRDTSGEAVTDPGRDLRFRNLDDEAAANRANPDAQEAAQPNPPTTETPTQQTPPREAPVVEQPKFYAGKYKSVEELERAYDEAQKLITRQGQEKAELVAKAQATPPPAPAPKTTAQIAEEQAENNRIINDFATNPKEFIEKNLVQRVQTALTAQQVAENWRTNNPDLKEHEVRVAFEATLLAQSDPELARNPSALLTKATDTFRQFTGRLRTEGAKEALTQETRTIPLLSNSAPAAATEHPSTKAPLTADAAFDKHMAMLKEQEQKSHRGLRR